MDYRKMADNYYSCRYFFTLEEYFKNHNITNETTKRNIKLELLEIEKEETRKDKLLDTLLKSCVTFKFSQSSNRNSFFIYHPCTKKSGYQVSFFYNDAPVSDIFEETMPELKKALRPYLNKYDFLEETIGKSA